jgi:hypothetical protein
MVRRTSSGVCFWVFVLILPLLSCSPSRSPYSGTAHGLSPFPHLSLTYGDAYEAYALQRPSLSALYAGGDIVLDRLAICRSSSHVPIEEWTCLTQLPLAST